MPGAGAEREGGVLAAGDLQLHAGRELAGEQPGGRADADGEAEQDDEAEEVEHLVAGDAAADPQAEAEQPDAAGDREGEAGVGDARRLRRADEGRVPGDPRGDAGEPDDLREARDRGDQAQRVDEREHDGWVSTAVGPRAISLDRVSLFLMDIKI